MTREDRSETRYSFIRDDVRRRIRIIVREPLQPVDTHALVDRQVSELAWRYGMLYDLRAVHAETPKAEVRALADYVGEQVAIYGARGPVASDSAWKSSGISTRPNAGWIQTPLELEKGYGSQPKGTYSPPRSEGSL